MSTNNLAILLDLANKLGVKEEAQVTELKSLIENKTDEELDREAIVSFFNKAVNKKVEVVTKNAAFDKNKADEEYKKAERKFKKQTEDRLKELFGLENSEATTLEDLLVEAAATKVKTGKDGLQEDAVKTHPLYLSLEKRLKDETRRLETEKEEAIANITDQHNQEKVFGTVSEKALNLFNSWKPVLSEDAAKAANQRSLAISKLKDTGHKFEIVNDEIIIIGKDGKRLEDEAANTIEFEAFFKSLVEPVFDFEVTERRKAPNGSINPSGNSNGKEGFKHYTGKLPKNKEEQTKLMYDETLSLEARKEISTLQFEE